MPASIPRPVNEDQARGMLTETGESDLEAWEAARDRAVLTLLYGCGLRISEALSLTGADAPLGDTVRISGKGSKMRLVPVLPVSLMATILLEAEAPLDELELKARASDLIAQFETRGAKLYLPRSDRDYAFHVGLRMLSLRHLVEESGEGLFSVVATERPVLAHYAKAIAHLR